MNKRLLIFSAHPDDHLSCAGTAMYLKSLGFEIIEMVFTGGENSINKLQDATKVVDKKALIKVREKEFKAASKILGTKSYMFLGQPNGDVKRSFELVLKIVEIIRKVCPLIVISENPNDYHTDHRAVGEIVTEAIERAGWGVQRELGAPYKTPMGLYMGTMLENERLDILFDITKFWDKKRKMLKAYGSQIGSSGFQLDEALAKYCGYYMRVPYAESFEVMKNFPIKANVFIQRLLDV